jgi:hypothetical protein
MRRLLRLWLAWHDPHLYQMVQIRRQLAQAEYDRARQPRWTV